MMISFFGIISAKLCFSVGMLEIDAASLVYYFEYFFLANWYFVVRLVPFP